MRACDRIRSVSQAGGGSSSAFRRGRNSSLVRESLGPVAVSALLGPGAVVVVVVGGGGAATNTGYH